MKACFKYSWWFLLDLGCDPHNLCETFFKRDFKGPLYFIPGSGNKKRLWRKEFLKVDCKMNE